MKRIIVMLLAAAMLLCAPLAWAEEQPASAEAPSAEALSERYFAAIASLESGTAGASLKAAIVASEVCAFAEEYALYNPDAEALRANLRSALEAMDAAEQAAFWTNFDGVRGLLDASLEDFEANRGVFEDAGVGETMETFMADPLNRLAWENLREATLALGNAGETA